MPKFTLKYHKSAHTAPRPQRKLGDICGRGSCVFWGKKIIESFGERGNGGLKSGNIFDLD
jgi:hypothetical protein